ncbi:unnamed protein product [Moneuplotes crassus]|uniref:Uncharacterized protein n=1 Tax=Euplotes crassus TaxID=5936 RepID=A0AAD1XTE4_EUPCR|nr:unnamed protein product [Moneuplotes crassus]
MNNKELQHHVQFINRVKKKVLKERKSRVIDPKLAQFSPLLSMRNSMEFLDSPIADQSRFSLNRTSHDIDPLKSELKIFGMKRSDYVAHLFKNKNIKRFINYSNFKKNDHEFDFERFKDKRKFIREPKFKLPIINGK